MAQICTICESNNSYFLLFTLLSDNILSFMCFLYQHPLQLAYILYFSPYIFQLLSFLFPLLLSTSILLLVLLSLHSILKDEAATICFLEKNSSVVVDSIGNVFEWNFEAMGELYMDMGLICETEEDPDEICVENFEKSELLESHAEISNKDNMKSGSFDNLNHKASTGELYEISSLSCYLKEDPLEISLERSKMSEILESNFGDGDDKDNSERCSFVPQTPGRISETLSNSPLTERAKQLSSPICGIVEDPGKTIELSRSQSEKGGILKSEKSSRMHEKLRRYTSVRSKNQESRTFEGLQRNGSTRKEKEWKRTLACKLYEERMTFKLCDARTVVEGAEEMDLLWEAYESDADRKAYRIKNKAKNSKREMYVKEEEDDEEIVVGQLCCLQALKISSGKMNLGVGRNNLSKISKAFRGIGFLHRSSSLSRKP